ncbi:MAG: c-type cytochrome [Acetobacteraceae bacterium]
MAGFRTAPLLIAALAFGAGAPALAAAPGPDYGVGQTATQAQISAWNIDVEPDGKNLPAGSGTVADGAQVYATQCAVCHGAKGEGGEVPGQGTAPRLVGGIGTLASAHPVKTVGSYWPYATTVFDYIRRAMPFQAPGSLSNDQVYALVAYILNLNGIVPDDAVMDRKMLPKVEMPNRNGFVWPDPRPDTHATACMTDCPQ